MKKVLASITLIVYLAVTCGIVVNFHYCMDRLASTKFFVSESSICPQCGMHTSKSHGCCRDEMKVIKLQADQLQTQLVQTVQLTQTPAITPSAFLVIPFYNNRELHHWQNHIPPLLSEQDTYLQNSVFRI